MNLTVATIRPDAQRVTEEAPARLRAMVEENFAFVWRLLRRLGVPSDRADDAAQEVFLVASARIADVGVGKERSFLFGTALLVAKAERRTRGREPAAPVDDVVDPSPQLDELADQKKARETLDRILVSMDETLRVVLVLNEFEGLTTPEIAEIVGIPVGTAASRLRRAREEFEAAVRRLEASRRHAKGGVR